LGNPLLRASELILIGSDLLWRVPHGSQINCDGLNKLLLDFCSMLVFCSTYKRGRRRAR
jgi:hypothetical protein